MKLNINSNKMMSNYMEKLDEERHQEIKLENPMEFMKKYIDLFSVCLAREAGVEIDFNYKKIFDKFQDKLDKNDMHILVNTISSFNNLLCTAGLRYDLEELFKKDK